MRALALVALLGCTPASSPPSPDASPAATAACAHLRALGCIEGADPACESRVTLAISENHTTLQAIGCVAKAQTKADARACGGYFGCPGAP